jgi:predicted subunit of tRNA(5-methylaminomethyl-2-thiouridylate) methyltransferase
VSEKIKDGKTANENQSEENSDPKLSPDEIPQLADGTEEETKQPEVEEEEVDSEEAKGNLPFIKLLFSTSIISH